MLKTNKFHWLVLKSILLCTSGVTAALATPSLATEPTLPNQAVLGYGYSTSETQFKSMCFKLNSITPHISKGASSILSEQVTSDLSAATIAVGLAGGVSIDLASDYPQTAGLFNASFENSRMLYYTKNNLTRSYVISIAHQYPTTSFAAENQQTYQLTPEAQAFFDAAQVSHNWSDFRDLCGDAYVSEISYSALLVINISLHFLTDDVGVAFDMTFRPPASVAWLNWTNGPFKTLYHAYWNFYTKYNPGGNIIISATQQGGIPQRLGNIFKKAGAVVTDNPSAGMQSFDFNCDPRDKTCLEFYDNILDYPNEKFKKEQLKTTHANEAPTNTYPVATRTQPYTFLFGGNEPAKTLVPPKILNIRQRLVEQLGETNQDLNRVNYLQQITAAAPFIYGPLLSELNKALVELKENRKLVQKWGLSFFDDAQMLQQSTDFDKDYKPKLYVVDLEKLSLPKNFMIGEYIKKDNKSKLIRTKLFVYDQPATLQARVGDSSATTSIFRGIIMDPDHPQVAMENSAHYQLQVTHPPHEPDMIQMEQTLPALTYTGKLSNEPGIYSGDYSIDGVPQGRWLSTIIP